MIYIICGGLVLLGLFLLINCDGGRRERLSKEERRQLRYERSRLIGRRNTEPAKKPGKREHGSSD